MASSSWFSNGRKAKLIWLAVIGVFGGIATIATGSEAWDKLNLPRWAWRSEVIKIADVTQDTRLRVLYIEKRSLEQTVYDTELMKFQVESQGGQLPPSILTGHSQNKDQLEKLKKEIEKLEGGTQ